jgi:hypothetical protein
MTDDDITYKKQKAVECNVSFNIDNKVFIGYFLSSLRRKDNPDFEGRQLLMPDEMPILILPTNNDITINTHFEIEGKYWNVVEYDNISNKGITYYYIERYFKEVKPNETIEEETIPEIIENEELIAQEVTEDEFALRQMVEYVFSTEDAYFAATPAVEIISRQAVQIKFKIPFGIEEIVISTKINGTIVDKIYKVVL